MCGIFGYFDQGRASFAKKDLQKMADSIDHRGPDDLGIYVGDGCGIGNQRLAIIDIEHGQQPFISEDGSVYVVQNGEIFNHVELSRELAAEGFPCRTKSDTEVILRLYQHSGIRGLNRLNGMFAIAIYDQKCDALFLVRDRVGEKPLYYYYDGIRFVFASEIKAILALDVRATLCHQALSQYLSFNYVPPPLTMFEGIRHVLPGHWMRVTRGGIESGCWWDLADIDAEERVEAEWIDEFNHILDDAVRLRLRADVPFGAFLSGGVDSSTVVGLMSRHLEIPVKTFCIGFDDPRYDESPHALEASRRFGTEHVMERVKSRRPRYVVIGCIPL